MAETTHRRVKNSSLCLRVGNPEQCDDLMWTFNDTLIVVNKQLKSNDTRRVDYKSSSHSMCINGLTESDAGIYIIYNMCGNKKVTETHILHVLGKSSVFVLMAVFHSQYGKLKFPFYFSFPNENVTQTIW